MMLLNVILMMLLNVTIASLCVRLAAIPAKRPWALAAVVMGLTMPPDISRELADWMDMARGRTVNMLILFAVVVLYATLQWVLREARRGT